MKHSLTLFFLSTCYFSFSQIDGPKSDLNKIFEIHLDSIERKLTLNKKGMDTSYFLHYNIRNISEDTLTYVTNSCFYYNHYILKYGEVVFDLNKEGNCSFNSLTPHKLSPGQSFYISEWVIAPNMNTLIKGESNSTLSVSLVKDDRATYRVDGRSFITNAENLVFESLTKVTETTTNKRKGRR